MNESREEGTRQGVAPQIAELATLPFAECVEDVDVHSDAVAPRCAAPARRVADLEYKAAPLAPIPPQRHRTGAGWTSSQQSLRISRESAP